MTSVFEPLSFPRGRSMKNRFMLAPLTNCQSHDDGTLSEAELRFLQMRAEGGFGLVMTCASHVQAAGQGFPGQLGCFGDQHLPGLTRLASALREAGSVAVLQLYHGGIRAPKALTGVDPVGPSAHAKSSARALTRPELEALVEDFARAAERAERAGFDGVELHGAHGYLLCQFLSAEHNQRDDEYGGSLEHRARLLFELVAAVRRRCRPDFLLGVRLSPERFGMRVLEIRELCQRLIDTGQVDFLDLSLWDAAKEPHEPELRGRSLISYFMDLDRKGVRVGVVGKLHDPADVARVLAEGADFAILGRAAILCHDYPKRLAADPSFTPVSPPVSPEHLEREGLSPPFVRYMRTFPSFVQPEERAPAA